MKSVLNLPRVVKFIWRHPLSRQRRLARLGRFVRWQVGARLVPGPVIVPFVEHTRLVVRPGMQGATGNVYTGLHEFDEMAFVLHALRPDDLFVDVGANVGTYTVLAAGVVGCPCVAIEPVASTYEQLIDNLRLNQTQHLVDARFIAVGHARGSVRVTNQLGPMNRVVESDRATHGRTNVVAMQSLDDVLSGKSPTIIKIDVEGFEPSVVAGALNTLRQSSLLAVLMETNRNVGRRTDGNSLREQMRALGFDCFRYQGLTRRLERFDDGAPNVANTIFARSAGPLLERIRGARRIRVLDTEF
jgi:FkbM family methyltransferase